MLSFPGMACCTLTQLHLVTHGGCQVQYSLICRPISSSSRVVGDSFSQICSTGLVIEPAASRHETSSLTFRPEAGASVYLRQLNDIYFNIRHHVPYV